MNETLKQRIERAGRLFDEALRRSAAYAFMSGGSVNFAAADQLQKLHILRNRTPGSEILDIRNPEARQSFIAWAIAPKHGKAN